MANDACRCLRRACTYASVRPADAPAHGNADASANVMQMHWRMTRECAHTRHAAALAPAMQTHLRKACRCVCARQADAPARGLHIHRRRACRYTQMRLHTSPKTPRTKDIYLWRVKRSGREPRATVGQNSYADSAETVQGQSRFRERRWEKPSDSEQ